jgi:hypothetical protein
MRYEVKNDPTDENIRLLIEAARKVESEWITVIKCAYEAGIKTSNGRRLGPSDLDGNAVMLSHPNGKGKTRRELSDGLFSYLTGLPGVNTCFCPRLAAMTTTEFNNSWKKVCTAAGFTIQLIVLVWPYRNANKQQIEAERSRRYLEHVANTWLKADELEKLKENSMNWAKMGSKTGNAKRRLTRGQILSSIRQG